MNSTNPLLIIALAGAFNQQYQDLVDFLNSEIKVLKEIFVTKRIKFNNEQRAYLAAKFKKLNREVVRQQELIVTPETLMKWYKNLICKKWDYSDRPQKGPGRPPLSQEVVDLVLKLIKQNPLSGDVDISNKLKNLGLKVSPQSVRNIRKQYGVPPEPEREKTGAWEEFLKLNWEGLVSMDFKQVEVNIPGTEILETHFVLFAMCLSTREVKLVGITRNPKQEWMVQMARNLTDPFDGFFTGHKYCIMDNDKIFAPAFLKTLKDAGVKPKKIVVQVPNMNAHIERFIQSYKNEALKWLIPQSEQQLRSVTKEWLSYYNSERNHQGIDHQIIQPKDDFGRTEGEIKRIPRLGGTLNYYHREAA